MEKMGKFKNSWGWAYYETADNSATSELNNTCMVNKSKLLNKIQEWKQSINILINYKFKLHAKMFS